jgi:hypothetical protein
MSEICRSLDINICGLATSFNGTTAFNFNIFRLSITVNFASSFNFHIVTFDIAIIFPFPLILTVLKLPPAEFPDPLIVRSSIQFFIEYSPVYAILIFNSSICSEIFRLSITLVLLSKCISLGSETKQLLEIPNFRIKINWQFFPLYLG